MVAAEADMEHVLIQIVADDQGKVRVEYLADLVRLLPPLRPN